MASGSINTIASDMGSREAKARQAGEILYGNAGPSSRIRYNSIEASSLSRSISLPEDRQACCGIMSPVRRTFCLMVLFDLVLTFILWVIYTQVSGIPFNDAFSQEVLHYTFKESLFDLVMCAAWRFVPLLLVYALFRVQKPWAVAVTTFGTCVFLLVKIFLFDFHQIKNNIMGYLLLIVSFVISWIETWFLDFKVLPREQKARDREAFYRHISERQPLLDELSEGFHIPGDHMDQYYSPVESREGSDTEEGHDNEGFQSVPHSRSHSRQPSQGSGSLLISLGTEEQEYVQKGKALWEQAWAMAGTVDGWKLVAGTTEYEGCVHTRTFDDVGKVYRLQGVVRCSPRVLFQELVRRPEDTPRWNPTILECKVLQVIDDTTDIMYNVAAEAGGGIISSRDFVNLRHWGVKDGSLASVGCSVTHSSMPPTKRHVRGENGPGIWVFKAVAGDPSKCMYISIVNTDLKGWLPHYVVDQALASVFMDYLKHIRTHISRLSHRPASV